MDQTILYILIIAAICLGLTMMALIDIILKDFKSTKEKITWHFIAVIPVIGWVIYFIFGAKKGQKRSSA